MIRFTIREILLVTTIVAALLAIWVNVNSLQNELSTLHRVRQAQRIYDLNVRIQELQNEIEESKSRLAESQIRRTRIGLLNEPNPDP